jgi:hypothetical protein
MSLPRSVLGGAAAIQAWGGIMTRTIIPWVLWLLPILRIAVVPAVGACLVVVALRTREFRCLWLLLPGVLAPVVGWFAIAWEYSGMNRLCNGERVGVFPFTLVEAKLITAGALSNAFFEVSAIAGSLIFLFAVCMIYRRRSASGTGPCPAA